MERRADLITLWAQRHNIDSCISRKSGQELSFAPGLLVKVDLTGAFGRHRLGSIWGRNDRCGEDDHMTGLQRHKPRTFIRGQRRIIIYASVVIVGFLWISVLTPTGQGQALNPIHTFTGGADGANPYAGLSVDRAGNFYGTTYGGGLHNQGVVFKLMHRNSGWILTPLYDFQGGTADGQNPESRVIVGPDGRLYGTTPYGGNSACGGRGCGIVYGLTPPGTPCAVASCQWQETVVYRFTGLSDGANPGSGDLLLDQAGNIYGTTAHGGANGNGVVYKLTRSDGRWTESVLYSFTGSSDGAAPWAGVIFDRAGNLYGATFAGGSGESGTVYELMNSGTGWTEKTLHAFQYPQDGGSPTAGVIFDQSGNLYGATCCGGTAGGGTAFELMPAGDNWTFSVLYAFPGILGGGGPGPAANLLLAQGNLYGTTAGWIDGNEPGSAFKLTPSQGGWTEDVLHQFTLRNDGANPYSNLIMDAAGNLYGTASIGGAGGDGYGVVFQITP